MTFRQKLYEQLPTWLAYISTANGYANTVREPFKGVFPASANNTDLKIFYYLGDEKNSSFAEDDNIPEAELSLILGWFFKCDAGEGKMIDQCESMIADLNKWCYAGAANNKYFMPDSAVTGDLSDYQTHISAGVEPYYSFNEQFGMLYYEIKVKYILVP